MNRSISSDGSPNSARPSKSSLQSPRSNQGKPIAQFLGRSGRPRDGVGDVRFNLIGDEESLARGAVAGQGWAQREMWERYSPMVYGLLRRTLGSGYDHEDLMQEVFLRVFRRLHSLEKFSALRSFVYSVAFRVVSEEIRHFRVVQRAKTRLLDIPRAYENPGADYEMRDLVGKVGGILDGLKPKHRAVFVLRHVEGLDLFEIAVGLDISLATVKRYLARAMRYVERSVAADGDLSASLSSLGKAKPARDNG